MRASALRGRVAPEHAVDGAVLLLPVVQLDFDSFGPQDLKRVKIIAKRLKYGVITYTFYPLKNISFFSILEQVATRQLAWDCFSATRPIWGVLHRKPLDVFLQKYHGLAIFSTKNISEKMFFYYFFDVPRIAWRSSRYLKRTALGSHLIPAQRFGTPSRNLGVQIFSPADPVWSL